MEHARLAMTISTLTLKTKTVFNVTDRREKLSLPQDTAWLALIELSLVHNFITASQLIAKKMRLRFKEALLKMVKTHGVKNALTTLSLSTVLFAKSQLALLNL